ncbi:MAG: RIP metalloprotease RseP [Bacteroidales bacterium]|jgi:regulator of sigma E protease|nr:RIP metalloprotease RseP [Bacteroidales bacterium]
MTGLIMALQLIAGLSLLVFIHEMGHYLAARMFGIRVNKFYLFFDAWGVKLFSFKRGDTEFGIGWLPLGGYCQIAGMIDETQDADDLASEPQPWEYRSKPAWQRLIVIFGGIFLNFVTGILILSFILLGSSKGYLSNDEISKFGGITPSPVAQNIGFQNGDKILSINGKNVVRFQDAQNMNVLFGSEIAVLRGHDTIKITIPKDTYRRTMGEKMPFFAAENFPVIVENLTENSIAKHMGILVNDRILQINEDTVFSFGILQEILNTYKNQDIEILVERDVYIPFAHQETVTLHTTLDTTGKLGIFVKLPFGSTHYTLSSALVFGYKDGMDLLKANARGLSKVISGKEKATETIQGPIGMAQIYGSKWDWLRFWYVTGILSLILAFMNFLPIPALDGGHILFTLWEIITRRKPSDKFLMATQQVGMILLITLMVFAFGNDLFRIFR